MSPAPTPRHAAPAAGRDDAAAPRAADDWPAQAADTIERVVSSVRDRTTGPAITVARWVVYGTFALVVGAVLAVLVAIASVRMIDAYLPDAWVGEDHTWAAHLLVGAAFGAVGMVLWARRSAPGDR